MLKTEKLTENVVKILTDPCVYIILDKKIIIDTTQKEYKEDLKQTVRKFISPEDIKKVILTHLHYDHIGNVDLFPDAEFFASPAAMCITDEERINFILNPQTNKEFDVKLKDITQDEQLKEMFDIYMTPGHCKSCITLYLRSENILFTGDTYFNNHCFGRTDLPTSQPEIMQSSVNKVFELIEKHKPIIAPGHDY
ncbi:MBL fold metallo-hydrolase [Candidatus Woesearchaeota archaeon]|nr:MBL fold metallo-hydrolase [Candidatus Woesearchaeota archaeon]